VLRASLLCCGLLLCQLSAAWSAKGHERLTEAALNNLTEQERQYFEVRLLYLPGEFQAMGLPGMSAWVDRVREIPIKDVFALADTHLPRVLSGVAERDSSRWHYQNRFIYATQKSKACRMHDNGELRQRLLDLHDGLQLKLEPQQQIVMLAFFLHLLQDMHQPLHTMSRVGDSCRSDRGGNGTCVTQDASGQCEMNLHRLWDGGFGLFDQDMNLSIKRDISKPLNFPESLDIWLDEGPRLAREIYAVKPGTAIDPMYFVRSREHVRRSSEKAVERMTWYLKQYYKGRTNSE
jgi:hypothetical protein